MIKVEKLNPFGRMCISLGMLPSSYKESLTYEEQLLWFFKYLDETVIPTLNNNADAIEEVQALYIQIKEYVDNYFENLDVQEEINNKLDAMVEEGTLQEIITQYLNAQALFCYNSVADLKEATNLINGSYVKTLGYYEINDGGQSLYKITSEALTPDDEFIIELENNLYAVLVVSDFIYPEQIGAIGDGSTATTTKLQNILDKNLNIKLSKNKTYKIGDVLRLPENTIIDFNNSTIKCTIGHSFYNFLANSTATEYNGNGKLTFKNGTVEGGCISLMHAENVLFENMIFKDILTNHNIELCACKDVVIKDCIFYANDGEYTQLESINIDPCVSASFPWLPADSPSYDGTPNINIDISNCIFYGGEDSLIRDGVGAHASSVIHHKYINVHNCTFENVREDGIRLMSCDYSRVNDNLIISQRYGISISGNHDVVCNNKIISLYEEGSSYCIRIMDDCAMFSEYNNLIIVNNVIERTHLLVTTQSISFERIDNLRQNITQTYEDGVLTVVTDEKYNLFNFNKLRVAFGAPGNSTFQVFDLNAWVNRNFQANDGWTIPEIEATIKIVDSKTIEITCATNPNLRFVTCSQVI